MRDEPKAVLKTTPYAINSEATLVEAEEIMKKHKVRHLPVVKEGKTCGLISDRDLKSVMAFHGANPKEMRVWDFCMDEPYMTKPDASLDSVATEMAERKMGSALVLDNGKLVGIFTATDACKALADICKLNSGDEERVTVS
jgi:acetoin utilization protein AcuB